MANPYVKHPAEGENFVGRNQYYKKLQQYLEEKSSIILVTGERGIGKTSFVRNVLHQKIESTPFFIEYRAERELESGFLVPDLYKRLDKKSETRADKMKSLVKKLDALQFKASVKGGVPSIEIGKPSGAFSGAADLVEVNHETVIEIKNSLEKIKDKIVVLVENAYNLSPAEQKVFDILVRSPNFFVIMEVPTVEMGKIVIRDYKCIDIGRLSKKESMDIIRKGNFLDEETAEHIYEVSEGNPYYIQSICWLLYEKYLDGDTIGIPALIDTLKGKKLRDRQDIIHNEILKGLDVNARQLVKDLSIAPFLLTHKIIKVFSTVEDVDGALSMLVKKEIVLEKEEIFWVYHSLFREFLRSEQKNRIATELEGIYVKAAENLKKEGDCVLLLYELRDSEILSRVIEKIENKQILLDFGYDEFNSGNWESARLCFERGLDLGGELRFSFVGSLGIIFYSVGNLNEALKYYKEALENYKKGGYKQEEASLLGNIGLIYSDKGELDEALKYHEGALEIDREIGYKQGEASDLGNIGLIYSDKGELDEALKYLEEALRIFTSIQSHPQVLQIYSILFSLFIENEPIKAFSYMKKALEYAPDEENAVRALSTLLSIVAQLIQQTQWEYVQHITTLQSPQFKEFNSFFAAIGYYAQYKLSRKKEFLNKYHKKRKELDESLLEILDGLLKED
ncbi:MAG: tetratricopeptide repeat protein [Theionarchaea archaeon]|nr:tetratricopeptide repeat protein [Theionarchaea archaeon]